MTLKNTSRKKYSRQNNNGTVSRVEGQKINNSSICINGCGFECSMSGIELVLIDHDLIIFKYLN